MSPCEDDESTVKLVEEVDDTNAILSRFRRRPMPADVQEAVQRCLLAEDRRRRRAR